MTPRQVLEIEVSTLVGGLVLGLSFLAIGGAPVRAAPYLLGWAAGCLLHLAMLGLGKLRHCRRQRRP